MSILMVGMLMNAIWVYNSKNPISYDFWIKLRKIVDWLCDNWMLPDAGPWDFRNKEQHFVFSKVMVSTTYTKNSNKVTEAKVGRCKLWLAVERALRLAKERSFPAPNEERWIAVRDAIHDDIMTNGYNCEIGSFVQYYGMALLIAILWHL